MQLYLKVNKLLFLRKRYRNVYTYNVCDKIFGRFYVTEQNTL
jgi:hypothetical protein